LDPDRGQLIVRNEGTPTLGYLMGKRVEYGANVRCSESGMPNNLIKLEKNIILGKYKNYSRVLSSRIVELKNWMENNRKIAEYCDWMLQFLKKCKLFFNLIKYVILNLHGCTRPKRRYILRCLR
jgi:hypothetical protein